VLIFDEVMTGFRVAHGGAQALYGIAPDMTCLGKIVGGGLPAAAYGGKRAILEMVSPAGPVYQAGTLSGNPLAMAAGAAQLELLRQPGVYQRLDALTAALCAGIGAAAQAAGTPVYQTRVGSMFTTFFTAEPVVDEASAKKSNTQAFAAFFGSLLDQGVYIAPSQFEAGFVSLAHSDDDIARTVAAAHVAMRAAAAHQQAE
jgi:glutamate-1-semialdehyde 2,1-aminomutase